MLRHRVCIDIAAERPNALSRPCAAVRAQGGRRQMMSWIKPGSQWDPGSLDSLSGHFHRLALGCSSQRPSTAATLRQSRFCKMQDSSDGRHRLKDLLGSLAEGPLAFCRQGCVFQISFLPSPPTRSDLHCGLTALLSPPAPFPFLLPGRFPSTSFAHLIPFCHLPLGEPKVTQQEL